MNVYPSIDELAPREIRAIVPVLLMQEIEERYEKLGEKYLTDETRPDGRRINGMMYSDRIVNCREEIIDAVFCVLGQIFKDTRVANVEPSDSLYVMLTALIQVYSMCVVMEEEHEYWNHDPVEMRG